MIAPIFIWSGAVERHFAEATGNIEHVARLTKAGEFPAQFFDELLAFSDRKAKMRGAAREIRMVKIIGFDTRGDKGAHQRRERFDIIVHAAQQDTWLNIGIPASMSLAQAVCACGVNSRAWLA